MKILHTSDWHLGHQLCKQSRRDEHELFINWILNTIDNNNISLLILSGDIFDSGFPPNYALAQYYDFLRRLSDTCCRHAIIVGGNHDMPSTLNAPRELLKFFQIHVFGGAESDIQKQIVPIYDEEKSLEAIVCAVPYLRARELKLNLAGESYTEKDRSLVQSMTNHYKHLADLIQEMEEKQRHQVPIIATGHLFTAGGKISDTERDLYVGQIKHFPANHFPKTFDYVALGHLHHYQCPRENPPVYYSGSPVPLSFNESRREQYVLIVDLSEKENPIVQKETVPRFRSLVKIKGSLENVQSELANFSAKSPYDLIPWVEIQILDEKPMPDLHEKVIAFCDDPGFKLLKVICIPPKEQAIEFQSQKLVDLSPLDVFQKRCEADGISGEAYENLMKTFTELMFMCDNEKNSE
ncbi:exonuclease subunit SbcD [Candidatus Magnetomorum sp. HK-1]|nr:exonuclease subunit SbcD [Candidatus Magnetomorum sp. HK-1]